MDCPTVDTEDLGSQTPGARPSAGAGAGGHVREDKGPGPEVYCSGASSLPRSPLFSSVNEPADQMVA